MTRPSSPSFLPRIVTPSPPKHRAPSSSGKPLVSRSNSTRNRGITLNLAVSPLSVASSSSPAPKKSSLPQVTETSIPGSPSGPEDLKFDVPLPPMDHLMTLDIDDQLRLLALKEMSVVEIKDGINTLTRKLNNAERDLHKLREVIQKSLYKELSQGSSVAKPSSNPREEAIASTRIGARRRTLSSSSHNVPHINTQETSSDKRLSGLWSNLSKPLNMIQHLDTMLQNEFEKSLLPDTNKANPSNKSTHKLEPSKQYRSRKLSLSRTHHPRHSEDSISSPGSSIPSPLKSRESDSRIDLDHFYPPSDSLYTRNQEDMLQSVSSSIWTFVNDVKSNVLSSLGEEGEKKSKENDPIYDLENGSTISVEDSPDNTLKQADLQVSEGSDEEVDLTMYSLMRRKN